MGLTAKLSHMDNCPFASHLNAICTWHLSICNIVKGQRDVILNTDACRHFTSHSFNL